VLLADLHAETSLGGPDTNFLRRDRAKYTPCVGWRHAPEGTNRLIFRRSGKDSGARSWLHHAGLCQTFKFPALICHPSNNFLSSSHSRRLWRASGRSLVIASRRTQKTHGSCNEKLSQERSGSSENNFVVTKPSSPASVRDP
jgi:hypothetical protein